MTYKIGVDIGTTSTKAILYDEHNKSRAEVSETYPTYRPAPDRAEQDPVEIYAAFNKAIKRLTEQMEEGAEVSYLSFSSAMHALIAVDEAGIPLTNAVIWSDNRAQKQVKTLKEKADWLTYYQKSGTPIHPMSPFAKLLWMKEETDLLARTHKFIGIKEFIFHRLTGKYVVDYSIASATGLFNIHELEWDEAILAEIGLGKDQLSRPVDVTTALPFQTTELAQDLGLTSETKLIIGASDGCLANLGTGAIQKGEVALTIGTSGALRMTVEQPLLDEAGRTFCYYLSPGKWVIGGAVNNGGNVLEWLDGILYEETGKIYQHLPRALEKTNPGADGLFFFPYLNGERAPHWDGNLRGTYHGLSSFHSKHHLIRAALEGVLFNLKQVLEIVEEIGGEATAMKASGGFLQSAEWAQLTADVLGMDLAVAETIESSTMGAVLLLQPDIRLQTSKIISVNQAQKSEYVVLFDLYRKYLEQYVNRE